MKEQLLAAGTIRLISVKEQGSDAYFLRNLSKSYGDTRLFENETVLLPKKGIVLLSGPSGTGKTTLLHLIAGILPPDSGIPEGLEHARIAYLFQEDRLLPWYPLRKNLCLVAETARVDEWLRITELTEAADKYPEALSGGMKRRAALARAMAYGGDIYLLDEPFNGIDTTLKQKIFREILKAAEDALLILATHEEDIISQLTKTDEKLYHDTINEHTGGNGLYEEG